jgi:UDP:flavonoid glycosyltransferase YjiC (YdhE family)
LGDLHPFIAVGRALRERGVNVVIACAEDYRGKVEAAGVGFHAMRPGFDQMQRDLGMTRAQLTRGVVDDTAFMFTKVVLPYVRAAYEDLMAITADADLIVPSSLAFAARLAAEKRAIPWITTVLQPMMFLSAYDPPVIAGAEFLSAMLRASGAVPARYTLWILKKMLNGLFRPLHALRAELGLPPTSKNPLFDGQFSADGAIGLYSTLLGDVRPDYPRPTSVVGFAAFDSEDGRSSALPPTLEGFLDAGPPPLVLTLGSVLVHTAGNFYEQGAMAARALGLRAVLLVGEDAYGELRRLESPDVFVCAYAPHSLLFPRAAAMVHHGGIGTLAQGLRSGRPQLLVPHFADQLDNSARARRLGVARILPPRFFRCASARRELRDLLDDGRALELARKAAETVSAEDGAAGAARIVLDRLELLR